jgi:hypothetical protein
MQLFRQRPALAQDLSRAVSGCCASLQAKADSHENLQDSVLMVLRLHLADIKQANTTS